MVNQIFSFDPGLATGVCIWEEGEVDGWECTFRQVGDLLVALASAVEKDAIVVTESFTINNQTARNSQAPWSLEVIGLIRYFSMVHHLELVFQQPSAAKRLITDDVIKRAGLWVPGKQHRMDATRHMMLFDITSGKGNYKEWLIPPEE